MARFQSLPDRTDTFTTSISDQAMCQNYGLVNSCNLSINSVSIPTTKQRYEQTVGSGTFTVPAGINSIFIEVWGAGGGGGGNGNCCCCSQGPGGGAGGYAAQTITTVSGCAYAVCAAPGGSMGCGQCTNGGQGGTSYVTGFNLSNLCAVGGSGGCSGPCNSPYTCFGMNTNITGCSFVDNVGSGLAIAACGEGGHMFGKAMGCRNESKGGSAPFNGGIGAWNTYISCCAYADSWGGVGGDFPGGGGSGATQSCCCRVCNCGGCGAAGFVRIWY